MIPKYRNHKVVKPEGTFDSTKEYHRWMFLKSAQENGLITDLRKQVAYEVIPKQTKIVVKHLKTKDKYEEKFLEHPVEYVADFVYHRTYTDDIVVEDVKGSKFLMTPEFRIKKKLMLYMNNIELQVITDPAKPIYTKDEQYIQKNEE